MDVQPAHQHLRPLLRQVHVTEAGDGTAVGAMALAHHLDAGFDRMRAKYERLGFVSPRTAEAVTEAA